MAGTRVGNRIIGADSPIIVGWDNIPKVEGGPVKRFIFTYFQPFFLFALIAFWYYAPNSIATATTAIVKPIKASMTGTSGSTTWSARMT